MTQKSRIYWHAERILGLEWEDDDLTCSGITKQGKRCQNPINADNRSKIDALLKEASAKDVVKGIHEDMQEILDELAKITLCLRFHQKKGKNCQVEENLKKLGDAITEFRKSERLIHAPPPPALILTRKPTPSDAVKIKAESEEGPSRRTAQENFLTPPPSPGRETSKPPTREVRTPSVKRRPSRSPITPVNDSAFSSSEEEEESSGTAPETRTPRPSTQRPRAPALHTQPPASTPSSARTSRRRIPRLQVSRQTESPTCSFCGDAVTELEEAVWCRRECGHNMHYDCFEDHIEAKEREDVQCAHCNAPWFFDPLSKYYFDKNQ